MTLVEKRALAGFGAPPSRFSDVDEQGRAAAP